MTALVRAGKLNSNLLLWVQPNEPVRGAAPQKETEKATN